VRHKAIHTSPDRRILLVEERYLPNGRWTSSHPIADKEANAYRRGHTEYSVYCTWCLGGWWYATLPAAKEAQKAHADAGCDRGTTQSDRVRSSQTGPAALAAVTGPWKQTEVDWLHANPELSNEDAASHLGRSVRAVRGKRTRLGLTSPN